MLKIRRKMIDQKEKACPLAWQLLSLFYLYLPKDTKIHLDVKLFIKSVSDHYSVDFLGKGRVF